MIRTAPVKLVGVAVHQTPVSGRDFTSITDRAVLTKVKGMVISLVVYFPYSITPMVALTRGFMTSLERSCGGDMPGHGGVISPPMVMGNGGGGGRLGSRLILGILR